MTVRLLLMLFASACFPLTAQTSVRAVFAAGSAHSQELRIDPAFTGLRFGTAVAIVFPPSWPGGDLLVEAYDADSAAWLPVQDPDEARLRIRTAPGRVILLEASLFWSLSRIRLVRVLPGTETASPLPAQAVVRLILR